MAWCLQAAETLGDILGSESTEAQVLNDATAGLAAPVIDAPAARKKSSAKKSSAKKNGAKKNGASASNGSGELSKSSDDMLREEGGVGTTQ